VLRATKKQQQELFEPRLAQLYVWQTPVMLLNFSNILAVAGLAVLIVDKAKESGWAEADVQVGVEVVLPEGEKADRSRYWRSMKWRACSRRGIIFSRGFFYTAAL
jgi:hypothetical protein